MTRFLSIISLLLMAVTGFSQTADFTFQSSTGNFCNPATIQFTQKCSGKPIGFMWDVGTGQNYDANPSISYLNAGTYTVKLTAVYEDRTASVSKTVTINASINASIDYDRNYICKPGSINFNGVSNGNVATYAWDFGDMTAPSTVTSSNVGHNFSAFGNYTVVLTATSTGGCKATANASVTVQQPTITATVSPLSGCIPANVKFKSVVKVPANATVANYAWNFGDGGPVVNTAVNTVSKVYSVTGTFTPALTITTDEGCTSSYTFPSNAYGSPPTNMVAHPAKTVICGSENTPLFASATNANNYKWNFGDGTSLNTTDTAIHHKFKTLGIKTVKVTPYFNGCAGKVATFSIDVIGVIANYTYANTCNNKKTYSFTNTSLGNVSSSVWSFNNGNPNLNTPNAVQTFPPSGEFKTILSITDNITGCKDKHQEIIYTATPLLVNNDVAICKNDSTSFTIQNSYLDTTAKYQWNLFAQKIGPGNTEAITVKADSLGTFKSFAVINYGTESCPDTISLDHNILVRGPQLDFLLPANTCFSSPFIVTNNSHPQFPGDAITRWNWDFGEGLAKDTNYQPLPYLNKKAAKYKVTLYATDINGCSDSLVKSYTINRKPFLHIINDIDTVCLGQSDNVVAFHSDSLRWTPASLFSCANCDTTVVTPNTTTKIFATATSQFNCITTDSMLVKVYGPFTATAPVNKFYMCENESVQLDINPEPYKINWAPTAYLSNPNIYKPVASPLSSTTYKATLTDSVGCFSSSININVTVKTLPTVDAGPDKNYPYNAAFSFAPTYSSNVETYNWSPVTFLDCVTCAMPNGVANESQMYTVSVVSDSGCTAKDSVLIEVQCSADNLLMPGAFTPNNDKLNDYYYPLTRGVKEVVRFAVYNRLGQLIFESKNFPPNNKSYGWTGNFKGQDQPSSTYIYVLDVICDLGQSLHKQGNFILLR
jgi:gliding motility-associated-like protein